MNCICLIFLFSLKAKDNDKQHQKMNQMKESPCIRHVLMFFLSFSILYKDMFLRLVGAFSFSTLVFKTHMHTWHEA